MTVLRQIQMGLWGRGVAMGGGACCRSEWKGNSLSLLPVSSVREQSCLTRVKRPASGTFAQLGYVEACGNGLGRWKEEELQTKQPSCERYLGPQKEKQAGSISEGRSLVMGESKTIGGGKRFQTCKILKGESTFHLSRVDKMRTPVRWGAIG